MRAPGGVPNDPVDEDPASERTPVALVVPRGLVVLAAAWIFLAWIILFGWKPPVQPQAASYSGGMQLLFVMVAVGATVLWPLLRLSGRPSSAPMLQAVFDALAMLVLLQVVVWPLRLVTNWTLPRSVAIDCALGASLMTTAAILGAAHGLRSPRARAIAMTILVALAAIPPLLDRMLGSPADPSPLAALSGPLLLGRLSSPIPLDPSPAEWGMLKAAAAVAVAAWVVALVFRRSARAEAARRSGLV